MSTRTKPTAASFARGDRVKVGTRRGRVTGLSRDGVHVYVRFDTQVAGAKTADKFKASEVTRP